MLRILLIGAGTMTCACCCSPRCWSRPSATTRAGSRSDGQGVIVATLLVINCVMLLLLLGNLAQLVIWALVFLWGGNSGLSAKPCTTRP